MIWSLQMDYMLESIG